VYSVRIDCLSLPLATLRYLLGPVGEDEADRVRMELAELADVMPAALSWHDVYRKWRRSAMKSVSTRG